MELNSTQVSRRSLLAAAAASGASFALTSVGYPSPVTDQSQSQPARPPALEAAMVREFVGVCHGKFPDVQRLLDAEPGLLNATWDWGGGDFESGLGAASHMGNREIGLYLLDKGARMDLFAATMLGELDIVKAMLAARPDLIRCKGAHGIPLLRHAELGGAEAKAVFEYLKPLTESP